MRNTGAPVKDVASLQTAYAAFFLMTVVRPVAAGGSAEAPPAAPRPGASGIPVVGFARAGGL